MTPLPVHHLSMRLLLITLGVILTACSSTRHVPEGKYLLDHANITVEGDKAVKSNQLEYYLRQIPNHRVLLGWKLQLDTYNMSGRDSTKWYNKWVRKLGQPPAIYDQNLTQASIDQLTQAMVNRGYMDAEVTADTVIHGRKIDVNYTVKTGTPRTVTDVKHEFADSAIEQIILTDTTLMQASKDQLLDRDRLEGLRISLTEKLRNHGYYAIRKDAFRVIADTAENSNEVGLKWVLNPAKSPEEYRKAMINQVVFITDYDDLTHRFARVTDTVRYDDMTFLYGKDHYLKPGVMAEKCFLVPGQIYKQANTTRTYEGLAQLNILKSINLDVVPIDSVAHKDGEDYSLLDVYIMLSRQKKQSVTFEVEGTNSEGDLGFGIGLTHMHRNLARGSQTLTTKLRMSYESLSGNFNGLINDRYTEYGAEVGLTFPRFIFPFIGPGARRRSKVNSELATSFTYQERPEYTRIIAGLAWRYKWVNRDATRRHVVDMIDANYVRLPKSTIDFLNQIAPDNPLLRYSYEDHFIMRMGYGYYYTNRKLSPTNMPGTRSYLVQPNIYTLRVNAETAGNVLYAISKLTDASKKDGAYRVFGIQYAQYVKAEGDFGYTRTTLDGRQSFAFRGGFGIGVPYGNSTALPFEKRFYGGGANGVRGWSVRTLGPGSYDGRNSVTDFINQCGDIRLILTAEYRAKLFWVIESALFIDAGNIWTIKNYPNQPGGVFKFDSFYKQLAASYGVGLRMNFEYFLLRLDLGIKAHNPAKGQEPWPLLHPRWKRDTAFSFAVGYPF